MVRLRRKPGALVGFALVGLFIVVAIFAPLIAPFDPRAQDLTLIQNGCCQRPSAAHWFGVDQLGRDELTRIFYGARFSLLIGVVSVAVGLSIGLVLGAIAGYLGGFVDSVIMRAMDVMLAIPGLLLAIGIVAALGPGLFQIMIAVGVTRTSRSSRACFAARSSRSARTTSCSRRGRSACRGARSSSRTSSRTRSRR